MNKTIKLFLQFFSSAVVLFLSQISQAQQYQFVDIGNALNWNSSEAFSINNNGVVVGNYSRNTTLGSFLYSDGTYTTFCCMATQVNDMGQVSLQTGGIYYQGQNSSLGSLNGITYSGAFGINSSGLAVGYAGSYDYMTNLAITSTNGVMQDIGGLPESVASEAWGVNDIGQIVGRSLFTSNGAFGSYRGFLYDNGVMTDIGTLGGSSTTPHKINNAGVIIGNSTTLGDDTFHAFVYQNGVMSALNNLGSIYSGANGLNSHGDIVGFISGASLNAVMWQDGNVINLNTFLDPSVSGVHLYQAMSINDSGQIVGRATVNGIPTAFLLSPVPEADTLEMLLAGLGVIGFVTRRRKN